LFFRERQSSKGGKNCPAKKVPVGVSRDVRLGKKRGKQEHSEGVRLNLQYGKEELKRGMGSGTDIPNSVGGGVWVVGGGGGGGGGAWTALDTKKRSHIPGSP